MSFRSFPPDLIPQTQIICPTSHLAEFKRLVTSVESYPGAGDAALIKAWPGITKHLSWRGLG